MKFSTGMKKLWPNVPAVMKKNTKIDSRSKSIDQKQGHHIGPIFAYWAIVFT
jgi:hypothetical protein